MLGTCYRTSESLGGSLGGSDGYNAEAAIIHRPNAIPIECRTKLFRQLVYDQVGAFRRKLAQVSLPEHPQPLVQAVLAIKRRRAVEEARVAYFQPMPLQNWRVFADAGVIPRRLFVGGGAEHGAQSRLNHRD